MIRAYAANSNPLHLSMTSDPLQRRLGLVQVNEAMDHLRNGKAKCRIALEH